MSLLEIFTPVLSQLSGYVDTDPSGIQFLAQSTVSASYIISAVTSQRKISSLETHIRYNFQLIDTKLAQKVDYAYIQSDAFMANFVQAVRATETAESNEKVKIIAQALAGCTLTSENSKTMCMRIIDQITVDEIMILQEISKRYDTLSQENKFIDEVNLDSISRSRIPTACKGLFQLGLLEDEKVNLWTNDTQNKKLWSPSVLAQEVIGLLRSIPEQP